MQYVYVRRGAGTDGWYGPEDVRRVEISDSESTWDKQSMIVLRECLRGTKGVYTPLQPSIVALCVEAYLHRRLETGRDEEHSGTDLSYA